MTVHPRAKSRAHAVICAVLLLGAVGCTNTPPPPLVSAPATGATSPAKPERNQVVVGVDSVGHGYNPHKVADQSTMTTALASAMLPSVFRPSADGTPELDRTVMESAQVTSAEPFTVTYTVRPDASWSDGVPVRAEDFQYLRDQLVSQPGVVDAAGYRLISQINSRDNGRIVQVSFAAPYPGWRSLFNDLLPGHVLKDAPGGWAGALADGFPSSAGPFQIRNLDRDRGEVTLERNDRYWAKPALSDTVVFRRSDPTGLGDALRSGDNQLAVLHRTSAAKAMVDSLPANDNRTVLPRESVLQLDLRPVGPLADVAVRRAVNATLDRQKLIAAGGGTASARVDALTLAPSDADYRPTMPATPPADPRQLLKGAGYDQVAGAWRKAATALQLTVAAVADQPESVAVAKETVHQLTAAGIAAKLITPTADQLYTDYLGSSSNSQQRPRVDMIVGPRSTGGDPATELASRYGCPAPQPNSSSLYPAAQSGVCDPALDRLLASAMNGEQPVAGVLDEAERQIWAQAYTIPLFQRTDVLVRTPAVRNVGVQPEPVAPFAGAAGWQRVLSRGGR